jgi:hypothetical protein
MAGEHLYNILLNTKGKIFRATFIKRSTGEVRHLVGRLGVTQYLKGGTMSYNPKDKGLLTVYDIQKKGYRMINIEGLQEVSFGGQVYR